MKSTGELSNYQLECSGRVIYANEGVFALDEELQLTTGYDDKFYDFGAEDKLTDAERKEIATEMIGRWTKWMNGEIK